MSKNADPIPRVLSVNRERGAAVVVGSVVDVGNFTQSGLFSHSQTALENGGVAKRRNAPRGERNGDSELRRKRQDRWKVPLWCVQPECEHARISTVKVIGKYFGREGNARIRSDCSFCFVEERILLGVRG